VPERVDVTRKLVPFVVVDPTGRVLIDAPQAALCNRATARSERFEERKLVDEISGHTDKALRRIGSMRA